MSNNMNLRNYSLILMLMLTAFSNSVLAERIKDIASIEGIRTNQLVGFGLVVGLDKSGDSSTSSPTSRQSITNMLKRYGITLSQQDMLQLKAKNIATVAVQAELPAFAKPGMAIDVTVASIGDAKSLRGGALLMTPLKGADGEVYAIAQGNLVVGGMAATGKDGSNITINNPSAGRISNGALVERTVPTPFSDGDSLVFNLNRSDFTTATRMAESINKLLGTNTARAIDSTSVRVNSPSDLGQKVSFASVVENLNVDMDEAPARVIVNSRTGTVVISNKVRVSPAAVSHGSLVVTIDENINVSQPNALSNGQTAATPNSNVSVKEEKNRMFAFKGGVSLDDLVNAVNQVGAAPSDLVAILEALKTAGALHAELIII
jgi:flagellar P-ring protein precursor FlgI